MSVNPKTVHSWLHIIDTKYTQNEKRQICTGTRHSTGKKQVQTLSHTKKNVVSGNSSKKIMRVTKNMALVMNHVSFVATLFVPRALRITFSTVLTILGLLIIMPRFFFTFPPRTLASICAMSAHISDAVKSHKSHSLASISSSGMKGSTTVPSIASGVVVVAQGPLSPGGYDTPHRHKKWQAEGGTVI